MGERNLDFDTIVDRRNTKCLKYDFAEKRGYPKEVLPLWVADMDFKTSSYVSDALKELAEHNIYGYSNIREGDGFFSAVAGWMQRQHGWTVQPEWHVTTPGVCYAIATAVRALTKPGDAVLIQQPVYYPFGSIVLRNGRRLVSADLVFHDEGQYTIDFSDFEKKLTENDVKLFILCNPHNPVGRVWRREELLRLGELCHKHGVLVFSDEIHSDFVWKGRHQVFQEVETSFREFTITATAPSKTFNLAGLQQSNIFIPNERLRREFVREYHISGMDEPNLAGIVAAQAAYEKGEEWYKAMKCYVRENLSFAAEFVKRELPGVRVIEPEGTYLLWLDFRAWGLSPEALDDFIIHTAGLWLDSGKIFGKAGEGFQRINVACPRSVLKEALERLRR